MGAEAEEMIAALLESQSMRDAFGIVCNGDGTYWVTEDGLTKIRQQDEGTKAVLREFLKRYGRKGKMLPTVREKLDQLYAKIDDLKRNEPPRRYT